MQRIYSARDTIEAEFVRALLEREDIRAVVQGGVLDAARGDIPYTGGALPSVWINEPDREQAEAIVEEYRRGGPAATQPQAAWTCPKCGEKLEGQFTTCWNCGTEKPTV